MVCWNLSKIDLNCSYGLHTVPSTKTPRLWRVTTVETWTCKDWSTCSCSGMNYSSVPIKPVVLYLLFCKLVVHNNAVSFENGYFSMLFGLPSTLRRLRTDAFLNESDSIWKRSQKWRQLKTQAYHFSVDGRKYSLLKTMTLVSVITSCNLFSKSPIWSSKQIWRTSMWVCFWHCWLI